MSILVAAIDFHETRIWAIDADPQGRREHRVADNQDGTYGDDNDEYLGKADGILLLGHGNGKANASHHFVAYAEKHFSGVAAKLVAEVRCDIDDLTDRQVLRLAQQYFGTEPDRDFGDSRRGE